MEDDFGCAHNPESSLNQQNLWNKDEAIIRFANSCKVAIISTSKIIDESRNVNEDESWY